jgi:hypothetical protein
LKHGLLSKEVLLKGEDDETLVELGRRLRRELVPKEVELIFIDRIISSIWRIKRLCRIEKEMMEGDMKEGVSFGPKSTDEEATLGRAFAMDLAEYDTYGKLARYETHIERSLYRALHELMRLQSARKGEQACATPIAVDLNISGEH